MTLQVAYERAMRAVERYAAREFPGLKVSLRPGESHDGARVCITLVTPGERDGRLIEPIVYQSAVSLYDVLRNTAIAFRRRAARCDRRRTRLVTSLDAVLWSDAPCIGRTCS